MRLENQIAAISLLLFGCTNLNAQDDPFIPVLQSGMKVMQVTEAVTLTEEETTSNPSLRAAYLVGGEDTNTYYYIEIPLPEVLKDVDGGRIRLIMQHELDLNDQIRVIDEHLATEYKDDRFGKRGRNKSLYGWTRQSGGGEHPWMLGDAVGHVIFNPWGWAWAVDYKWGEGNAVLGGETIRIYSHPHVTTRVLIFD